MSYPNHSLKQNRSRKYNKNPIIKSLEFDYPFIATGFLLSKSSEPEFMCVNCQRIVPTNDFVSGVRNRNHCPYCLSSRHLDLSKPGDRLSACKSLMMPVGLSLKQIRKNYPTLGELMIVHYCTGCNAFSINRIAADDLVDVLYEIFQASINNLAEVRKQLKKTTIRLLGASEEHLVCMRLFGRSESR